MRDAIKFKPHKNGIEVGVFPEEEQLTRYKASGHNLGDSASGVKRRFIPDDSQRFGKGLMGEVRAAINDYKKEVAGEDEVEAAFTEAITGRQSDTVAARLTVADVFRSFLNG